MKPLFFLLPFFLFILYADDVMSLIAGGHDAHDNARVVDAGDRSLVQVLAETSGTPYRPALQWIESVCNWLTVPVASTSLVLSAVQRKYDDGPAIRGSQLVLQTSLKIGR